MATLDRAIGARLRGKAPFELRFGRLALLVLLLAGAALYVSPLRAFFSQQDRYQREVAALSQAQADNHSLQATIEKMRTKDYITRQARDQYQLVPAGMQAFVVKGLPEPSASAAPASGAAPAPPGPSLLARLEDLWRTLRE